LDQSITTEVILIKFAKLFCILLSEVVVVKKLLYMYRNISHFVKVKKGEKEDGWVLLSFHDFSVSSALQQNFVE
jgi:hypothetical protein